MKILIKGYYGFGNLGDDILLRVSHGLLKERFPEAEYYVFANFSENLKGYSQVRGYNCYIHTLLDGPVTLVDWTYKGHFDLVFNGGGGVYFDYQPGNRYRQFFNACLKTIGVHSANKLERILRILSDRPAHITSSKRIGAGLGIDYFAPGAPTFFEKFSELGSFDALWVRDNYSVETLKEFQFKRHNFQSTDLAFVTEFWKNQPAKQPKSKPDTMGILLLDWHNGMELLFSTTKNFVEQIRDSGYKVKFFSFDENHDKRYIETFSYEDIRVWRPNSTPLQEYLIELAECDIVLTGRAHGAILGACLGIFPICLAISKKMEQVADMFKDSFSLLSAFASEHLWVSHLNQIETQWIIQQQIIATEVLRNMEQAEVMKNGLQNHFANAE